MRFICLLVLSVIINGLSAEVLTVTAEKGFIDLSDSSFKKSIIKLNGEWEFYWNKLLSSGQFDSTAASYYLELPDSWAGFHLNEKKLDGRGYATFRLRAKLPPNNRFVLKIYSIHSAYRLWINGVLTHRCGRVDSLSDKMHPIRCPAKIEIPQSNEIEIVIQISNFHYRGGGINVPVVIGDAEAISSEEQKMASVEFFLAGAILIMALYQLVLFSVRKKDRASLYFGLFCIVAFMRILVTGEIFLSSLFGITDYRINIQIEYLSVYLMVPLFILYIRYLFPDEIKPVPVKVSLIIACILSVITLFTPVFFFTHSMPLYHPVLVIQFIWLTGSVILASLRKRQDAKILLFGFIFILMATFYDMMFTWTKVEGKYILPAGIFLFILSQTYILARRFAGAVNTIENISSELSVKNQKLIRLSNLKDDFLARVTHELRTPLYGITGVSEMLLETIGTRDSGIKKNLKMIIASSRRLAALVNDILDFSKLKNKDIMLFRRAVDLHSFANNIMIMLEPLTKNKNLRIVNAITEDFEAVMADEDRLQQIFYNLIGNSIKFTNDGEITVSAVLIPEDQAEISVKDTGTGIPEDKLKKVFDSFGQADSSDVRQYEGCGLGLPITKHLVELHGGRINIKSGTGEGTTVSFTLPVTEKIPSETPDRICLPKVIPVEQNDDNLVKVTSRKEVSKKPTVLVVDDDPMSVELIGQFLEKRNYDMEISHSGVEALKILKKVKPQVVLMDLMMPKMSGLECCRIIRQKHSSIQLPVIILTARNQMTDLVHSFKSGANDFLTKPFSRSELHMRINTQINIRKAYDIMMENQKLKTEINLRKNREIELFSLQKKLANMLDTIKDAVMAVDEDSRICYLNKQCEEIIKPVNTSLIGKKFTSLLTGKNTKIEDWFNSFKEGNRLFSAVQLRVGKRKTIPFEITVSRCNCGETDLSVLIFRNNKDKDDKNCVLPVEEFISELNMNIERIEALNSTIKMLSPDLLKENPQLQGDLNSIGEIVDKLQKYLKTDDKEKQKRILVVELLNHVINLWCKNTGLTKSDLAEKSGIWNVSVNKDGWRRTQTLDKYLDIKTLPRYPKLKYIEKTVEFVLSSCDIKPEKEKELEEMLSRIKLI
ncbi:MAG: response regulator [Fibrobacter sp.]|nr:response regulator [Fibrobacter sp.]